MKEFIDTHCHIHFPDYPIETKKVIETAVQAGVSRMLCVGCTLADSKLGIEVAKQYDNIWASVGIHPHEAKNYSHDKISLNELKNLAKSPEVVAIGEVGLDYYYNHSKKEQQIKIFKEQLNIAQDNNLPVIFHVREAFDDFFKIIGDYKLAGGVVHSFTANKQILDKILELGFYVGLNGIMTFTKDQQQLEMAKIVPLNRLLLETDAPYLTPVPFRGTICQPKHVVGIAEFLANLRGEDINKFATATTNNAVKLFKL